MRKLFHFSSSREHYKAEAAVVWCFDHRFELVLGKLLKRLGVTYFDPIRIAGGAKSLASPASERDRDLLMEQIRLSMRLHETRSVILMLHSDCGAYGGLGAFGSDAGKEAEHHSVELQRAAAYLLSQIPELTVRNFLVDFEGVWDVGQEDAGSERPA